MRLLFVGVIMCCMHLYADELSRINSLADDIANLRKKYEYEKEALRVCRDRLHTVQKQNSNLTQELEDYKALIIQDQEYEDKIVSLQNEIAAIKNHIQKKDVVGVAQRDYILHIKHTKPHAYRMLHEADIYSDPEKQTVVDRWEKDRSFTSNIGSEDGKWVRITGYFIDKKWQKAEKILWVRRHDVLQR